MRVLLVTKPLVAPWNDSAKNLADELVRAAETTDFDVLVARGERHGAPRTRSIPIYGAPGAFAPSGSANGRVLKHLLFGRAPHVVHYFFAPNPRTSTIARWVRRLRRVPAVQTVCSQPRAFAPNLFFGDRIVALSRWAATEIVRSGVAPERVVHVPPAITPPAERTLAAKREARARFGLPADSPLVLFPGDYEFGGAAQVVADAWPAVVARRRAHLCFACRAKTVAAAEARRRIEADLLAAGVGDRATFVGETPFIHDLLAASDVVVLPASSMFAKMDIPLVLLEALALGVPIVIADVDPVREVLDPDLGGADAGLRVPAGDAAALAAAIGDLLDAPARRAAMGQVGRRLVIERFGPARMAAQIEAIYAGLSAV